MLQLRRSNLIIVLVLFIFVFSSLHILGSSPEQDAAVSGSAGGRSGWRDWKWPSQGEKDADGGRWSDAGTGPSRGGGGSGRASGSEGGSEGGSGGASGSWRESGGGKATETLLVAELPEAPRPSTSTTTTSQTFAETSAPGESPEAPEAHGGNGTEPLPPPPTKPAPPATTCRSDLARHARPLAALNTTFDVPDDIVYDPKGPRPDQIVILTATDGGGHNGGIANIVERATSNRKAYCEYQGYRYHFVNISKYDLDGAHPVWKKLPAIIDAFNTYPDAQWVWMLDLDAIVMTPTVDLRDILLSEKGMNRALDRNAELHQANWKGLGMWTPDEVDFKNIDFLIAQDHNGVNAGSFWVRRSKFSQLFLDMWADPFFRKMNWQGQEQDTILHFVKHHYVFRQHLGVMKQRVFNAFSEGGPKMAWQEGDLVVHFAGCWVDNQCVERWEALWAKKGEVPGSPGSRPSEPEESKEKYLE